MRKEERKAAAAQKAGEGCVSWIEFYGLKIEKDRNEGNPFDDAIVFLGAKCLQRTIFPRKSVLQKQRIKTFRPGGCENPGFLYPLEMIKTGTNRQKLTKIGYVPGLVSAVPLPVAFCFFAEKKVEELSVTAVPFTYMDTNRRHYDEFLPRRNYTTIVFTGNARDDRIKLDFAQIMIGEIITGNDTANALHFLFTDGSRYETVIGLLDKLRIENAKYYFLYNKDAWFFHRQIERPLAYGCLLCNDVMEIRPEITWWEETKEKLSRIWLSSRQIILLFFCFTASVLFLKRKKKPN